MSPARNPGQGPGDDATRVRLAQRAAALAEVRRYFAEEDFLEVDTPSLTRETATEVHVEPLRVGDRYLITSPELAMKRLLVAGLPRIFQLARCFRADESGRWHAPEFLMLEWYRAHATSADVQRDTERLLLRLCERLRESDRLVLKDGRSIHLASPFERLTVREAFRRFAGVDDAVDLAATDEDRYFQTLVDDVEPAIARLDRPVFLHAYPATQAALARLDPSDPSTADRFELYVGGLELCNGYGELDDPVEQRARCERDRAHRRRSGRHVPELPTRFLSALERGMPPAGGNALGMDRLIALLLGQADLDGALAFARAEI